jgi:lipoate-protein ligase A
MILDYYGLEELTEEARQRIREDYITARRAWIAEIRKDAKKEFDMGDVEQDIYENFLEQLDHEVDYED